MRLCLYARNGTASSQTFGCLYTSTRTRICLEYRGTGSVLKDTPYCTQLTSEARTEVVHDTYGTGFGSWPLTVKEPFFL
jgi:hypothetical protein